MGKEDGGSKPGGSEVKVKVKAIGCTPKHSVYEILGCVKKASWLPCCLLFL